VERQGGRDEQGMALQRSKNDLSELQADGIVLADLPVVLDARGLMSGRDSPVDPVGPIEHLTRFRHLFGRQDVRNVQQHVRTSDSC
jgi:hypothetical protein